MGTTLAGKSVVVTGGGSGIGAACARRLAADGAVVTACGRTEDRLVRVVDDINAKGGAAQHVVADVTREDDVARLVEQTVTFAGGVHGFVANAGGGGGLAPLHLQDVETFRSVLDLNVVGTMLCIKHSVASLATTDGSFVGMSSIAGAVTHRWFGAYSPAKAAVETLVRNAADEYGADGVRFNVVSPGFTATETMAFVERGGPIWDSYVSQTPMGGIAQPDDVADLVRFLVSDESRWITGAVIPVDGGHGLRRGPDFTSLVEARFGADALRPGGGQP
jgi:NAD(P)-dependent dehydrogenase (short-subunit alcohol dehydrogenase family)